MQKRVRVRRDRPAALSWALALMVTMLAVYVLTLSPGAQEPARQAAARRERVTREVTLAGMTACFADLGVYDSAADARIAAAALAERGAAGVVWEDADGHHVLGAAYSLEADAERIARRIADQEGIDAGTLALSAGGVALRVTAPQEDIDAITAADAALRACLERISTLSLQVDRGEVGDASARTLAAVARSELSEAALALRNAPGAADEPLCAQLLAQADALCAQLQSVSRGSASGAALSGALRCCHVCGCLSLIQWLDAPAG